MGSGDKKDMDSFGTTLTIGALKALAFVCDIITFPVYVLLQRPWKVRALSRRVKGELVAIERDNPKDVSIEFDGFISNYKEKELLAFSPIQNSQATPITSDVRSITYKSLASPSHLHIQMIRENIDTMAKIMEYCVKHHANKKCLGTREIKAEEDEVQPNGRVFKKYVMGDYIWKTFAEVDILSTQFGKGIRELGNNPKENLAIFAETRAEWMVAAQGLFKQNIPVVTIYATLGDEGIVHAVNETEVKTIITSYDLMPKLKSLLLQMPGVKTLIYFEDQLKRLNESEYKDKVDVYKYDQVIKKGSTSTFGNTMPSPTDVAIIMYTSGSTGIPKGVILIHMNLIATLRAFNDGVTIYDDDCLIGFLPLAHVFELLVESVCLIMGISIGYSTPLTMIDTSSKIKKGTKGDASVLHPTCMTSVPLILDRISKGIQEKVSKGGFLTKVIFKFAYDYKIMWIRRGYSTPLLDKIIFGKIRGMLGGRVRLVLCGGAPLSPDTHEQIQACLCLTITQGYGLTETTACATIMDRFDKTVGRVGEPATSCAIRLVNWEEGNYRITDKPYPRGEIVCGGDVISVGYYKLPHKTTEDFFESDGTRWFKTGDIGEIHSDGVLQIIDRKKDLVKLQAGEYVSLGKVETELKTCPIVDNICIYGDSSKTYCVALVVPNQQHLADLAIKKGLGNRVFEDLCISEDMETAVLKELAEHGKKCRLQKFEIPAAVKLCTEVWSPDMGLVTAAFKLKRKDIQEKYQHEINRMYEVNRMYAS